MIPVCFCIIDAPSMLLAVGHAGICQQYAQFCPFEELNAERDASRINLAVVNVDAEMFYSLEDSPTHTTIIIISNIGGEESKSLRGIIAA